MKILITTLLTLAALPALAQEAAPSPMTQLPQAHTDTIIPMSAEKLAEIMLNTNNTIQLCPQNLHPGDQAVLLITSLYEKGKSEPICLRELLPENSPIQAVRLMDNNRSTKSMTEFSSIQVYRITLKADSYEFKPSDFSHLPEGFKFPELKIYREKR